MGEAPWSSSGPFVRFRKGTIQKALVRRRHGAAGIIPMGSISQDRSRHGWPRLRTLGTDVPHLDRRHDATGLKIMREGPLLPLSRAPSVTFTRFSNSGDDTMCNTIGVLSCTPHGRAALVIWTVALQPPRNRSNHSGTPPATPAIYTHPCLVQDAGCPKLVSPPRRNSCLPAANPCSHLRGVYSCRLQRAAHVREMHLPSNDPFLGA